MSGRSRRPPVVPLNGRAARRRNDEQAPASRAGRGSAPARGNGHHGRGGEEGLLTVTVMNQSTLDDII